MAVIIEQQNRNVIPRWRDFSTTVELGELTEAATVRNFDTPHPDFSELEADWKEHGTISFAADLLSAACLTGGSEVAKEAAKFVLSEQKEKLPDHPLTRLATAVLHPSVSDSTQLQTALHAHSTDEAKTLIAGHKSSLIASPRNAVLWVDLALLYAMQGLADKARRAMTIACTLEPSNRFVLRSAARLYIHLNEPDRAHKILRSSALAKYDPWIMSAEIATATAAKFIPFTIDQGLRTAANADIRPSETTELSAAIATLELRDGSVRKAKKHLRNGLREPNENSLAQVKWVTREMKGFLPDLSVGEFNVQRSFEALAWEAHAKSDFSAAAAHSIRWLRDQPFSSRPALVSANLASAMLGDYEAGIKLAKFGLIANPHEQALHIALAFAYGSSNRLNEAREALSQIRGQLQPTIEVTFTANRGLLEFREGYPQVGRIFYEEAVRRAAEHKEEALRAGALVYWAREEIRLGSPDSADILNRAAEAVKAVGDWTPELPFLLKQVQADFEKLKQSATKTI